MPTEPTKLTPAQTRFNKAGRRMALDHINTARRAGGLPLATRIDPLWWAMYGAEWTAKAKAAEAAAFKKQKCSAK